MDGEAQAATQRAKFDEVFLSSKGAAHYPSARSWLSRQSAASLDVDGAEERRLGVSSGTGEYQHDMLVRRDDTSLLQPRLAALETHALHSTVANSAHDMRLEMLQTTVQALAQEVRATSSTVLSLTRQGSKSEQDNDTPRINSDGALLLREDQKGPQHRGDNTSEEVRELRGLVEQLRQQVEQQQAVLRELGRKLDKIVEVPDAGSVAPRTHHNGAHNTLLRWVPVKLGGAVRSGGSPQRHSRRVPAETVGTFRRDEHGVRHEAEKKLKGSVRSNSSSRWSSGDAEAHTAAAGSQEPRKLLIPHESCPARGEAIVRVKDQRHSQALSLTNFGNADVELFMCAKRRYHFEVRDDDDYEGRIWQTCSENAYGAFLFLTLHDSCYHAFQEAGPALVLSFLLQCVLAWELWTFLPTIRGSPAFCLVPFSVQAASIFVFLTLMMNNVAALVAHSTIAFSSRHMRVIFVTLGLSAFACATVSAIDHRSILAAP